MAPTFHAWPVVKTSPSGPNLPCVARVEDLPYMQSLGFVGREKLGPVAYKTAMYGMNGAPTDSLHGEYFL